MAPKILLMYISEHSGHHKASLAIEEALSSTDGSIKTLSIDAFNYTNPILERVINKTYLGLLRTRPEVWEYLYDNPKVLRRLQRLRELINKHNSQKLKRLIDEFSPDAIVCTQAFPCGIAATFKTRYNATFLLYGVLTDYVAHSYWLCDNVDCYIVPSCETRDRLLHSGVPENRIRIIGIPIDPKFAKNETSKEYLYKKFNLRRNLPTVLVMGGGQGLGKIKDIVSSLDEIRGADFQVAVVAGVNKTLLSWLKRKSRTFRRHVTPFGYIDNINELMEASSLIVTKPGGLTTAEALAKGLPLVVVNPIPGQEEKNAEHLLKSNVAVRAVNERDVAPLVKELLNHPDKLKQMQEKASSISKPFAALEISRAVVEDIKNARLSSL